MFHLGVPELLIILVIVIVLFGVGRVSKIAGELGKGIHDFRNGLSGKSEEASLPRDRDPDSQAPQI